MVEIDEDLMIAHIERRLTTKYRQHSPDQIAAAIQTARARFEESPIRDFIPLLVERRACAALTGMSVNNSP